MFTVLAICMLYNVDIIVLVLCSSTIEYIPKENLDNIGLLLIIIGSLFIGLGYKLN